MRGFINASEMLLDVWSIPTRVQPNAVQATLLAQIEAASGVRIRTSRDYVAEVFAGKADMPLGGFFPIQDSSPFNADLIVINYDANKQEWYRVLFHELAHATGAKQRLNRFANANFTELECAIEEAVADKAALKLLCLYGLDTPKMHQSCERYTTSHTEHAMILSSRVSLADINQAANAAAQMVIQWCYNTSLYKQEMKVG